MRVRRGIDRQNDQDHDQDQQQAQHWQPIKLTWSGKKIGWYILVPAGATVTVTQQKPGGMIADPTTPERPTAAQKRFANKMIDQIHQCNYFTRKWIQTTTSLQPIPREKAKTIEIELKVALTQLRQVIDEIPHQESDYAPLQEAIQADRCICQCLANFLEDKIDHRAVFDYPLIDEQGEAIDYKPGKPDAIDIEAYGVRIRWTRPLNADARGIIAYVRRVHRTTSRW